VRGSWAIAFGSGIEADSASSSARNGSLKDAITLAMCISSGCTRFSLRWSSPLDCPVDETPSMTRYLESASNFASWVSPGTKNLDLSFVLLLLCCLGFLQMGVRNIANVNGGNMPKPSKRGHVTGRGKNQSLKYSRRLKYDTLPTRREGQVICEGISCCNIAKPNCLRNGMTSKLV